VMEIIGCIINTKCLVSIKCMVDKLDCVVIIFRVFDFITIVCMPQQPRKNVIFEIGDKILKIYQYFVNMSGPSGSIP